MKRTWLSIVGGVLLLPLSAGTGLGGLFYVALSHPENMTKFLERERARLEEQAGRAKDEQKQAYAKGREFLDRVEQRTTGPAGEAWLARWRPFGYFELFAAALGLVGAVGLIVGGQFGRTSGLLAGVGGAAACVWGSILGVPPESGVGLQIFCLFGYVVAVLGAFSIPAEPRPGG